MKEIKQKVKKLHSEVSKMVYERENYFVSKPESWQDSLTGDKYDLKTGILRELAEALDEQLSNF